VRRRGERKEAPRAASSARGAPGRWTWLVLAFLFGSCTTARPATVVKPGDHWGVLARLPGVFAHAGVAREGVLWIGGERIDHQPAGTVLSVDARTGRVISTLEVPAARVRALGFDDDAVLWAGGQDVEGRAYLAARRGGAWQRMAAPPEALEVDAVAVAGGRIVVTIETRTGAAVAAGSPATLATAGADAWTVGPAIRSAPGGSARLPTLAAASPRVVAAGTDGHSAVVVESADGGRTFHQRSLPRGATANAVASTTNLICGASPGADGRERGVLWLGAGTAWSPEVLPDLVSCSGIEAAARTIAASGSTGGGDVVLVSEDAGATWSARDPSDPGEPAVLEGVLLAGGRAFAYGTGAVYAGPG